MEQDKDKRVADEMTFSILETNSKITPPEDKRAQPKSRKLPRRELVNRIVAAVLTVVLIVGIFVGGGLLSEWQYQKEQAAQAAREMREGSPVFQNDEIQAEEGKLVANLTEAYYSAENGMWLVMTFANGEDTAATVQRVEYTINTEDGKRIVGGVADKIENCVVAAGGIKKLAVYAAPQYVSITDDALETLSFTIETEQIVGE